MTTDEARPGSPLIRLREVHKTYRREGSPVHALRGVDLVVEAGEFTAIMGKSGSGKSTLLHLLGLLDVDYEGSYLLDGHEMSVRNADELSRMRNQRIGFVFQTFHLLGNLSILENTELPALYARNRSARRCRADARDRLTQMGLDERLDHRPSELSIGQRQRAAIARALVNDPELLLADEPTGSLDSKTMQEILDILSGLHEAGVTVVLVTHDDDVASVASRVVHVRDGQILR